MWWTSVRVRAQVVTALLDRPAVNNVEVRGWILAALVKLVSQTGMFPDSLRLQVEKLKNSRDPDSQQRCYELLALKAQPALMRTVLPLDSSLEDLEVDPDMPFLNGFVQACSLQSRVCQFISSTYLSNVDVAHSRCIISTIVQAALRNGAEPYKSRLDRKHVVSTSPEAVEEPTMRFDAYDNRLFLAILRACRFGLRWIAYITIVHPPPRLQLRQSREDNARNTRCYFPWC